MLYDPFEPKLPPINLLAMAPAWVFDERRKMADLPLFETEKDKEIAQLKARVAELEAGLVAVPSLPDCGECINRGKVNGLSQESFCEQCVWSSPWRKDHFKAAQEAGDE